MSGFVKKSPRANLFMKRFLTSLCIALYVFVLSLPVFAADSPASLLQSGLTQTNASVGYDAKLGLTTIIGKLISLVLGVVGIVFVILAVYAGILYMTAAGDDSKVKKAKGMLIQAVIGIIIIVGAYAIANFVITQLKSVT
jgi:hypothetical protein